MRKPSFFRSGMIVCATLIPANLWAIGLVNPGGHFLNGAGQPYPSSSELQFDSRVMFRNTINGGAIAIGEEWVLHRYHSLSPNGGSGIDGYVGRMMDQVDNAGNLLGSFQVVASRESASLDYAIFKIQRLAAGGALVPAQLPVWVDPRQTWPTQPAVGLWGSFGPNRILNIGGVLVQDPPHPRGISWGTTSVDGISTLGLPSDVAFVQGDSGSGVFVRDGLTFRLARVEGPPINSTVQQQLEQWIAQMGGAMSAAPLQVPQYSTAALGAQGDWSAAGNWSGGVPVGASIARIDDDANMAITTSDAAAGAIFLAAGPTATSRGTLSIGGASTQLNVGSIIAGVDGTAGSNSRGRIEQSGGAVNASLIVLGYRGDGEYAISSGALSASALQLGRENNSTGQLSILTGGATEPSISVGSLTVGREGGGGVLQNAGTVAVAASLYLGAMPGGTGRYDISGGALNIGSLLSIGHVGGGAGSISINTGSLAARQTTLVAGELLLNAGGSSIGFVSASPASTIVVGNGTLRLSEGGIVNGSLNFGANSPVLESGGLLDLSAANITGAANAAVLALPGSLLVLPTGTSTTQFASVSAGGAIVHSLGAPILVPADRDIRLHGTLRDFVQVEGRLGGVEGIGGAGVFLTRGFAVTSGATLDLGSGGVANVATHSWNAGALTAPTLTVLSGATFEQSQGSTVATRLNVQTNATVIVSQGSLSAATLDVRGTLTVAGGELLVTQTALLRGAMIQSGGVSRVAAVSSSTPPPSTARIMVSGGSFTVGAIRTNELVAAGSARLALDPLNLSSTTHVLRSLSFSGDSAPTATLELNGEQLVVDYTGSSPIAALTTAIRHARNNGDWLAAGLGSSTAAADPLHFAVGIVEASDVNASTFGDYNLIDPLNPGAPITAVLIRLTRAGDASLDGVTNITDFARLAGSFNLSAGWSNGDFDYNGAADIADFAILAANFNSPLDNGLRIPEPGFAALLAAAVAAARSRSPHVRS